MTKRFALVFLIAVALQGVVFAVTYDDLLYLRMPVAAITAGPRGVFEQRARHALGRTRLTDRHLDTIAAAAQIFGMHDLEVRALERRTDMDRDDEPARLRLADALRRAGQFARAERIYRDLLNATGGVR